ncbi:LytTR family DNA-binding domain-containing protein [Caulobacter sp. NIBR1757]|uniref:LytTR family DNA-binding domain-containing protein n=1 Tax=Caulobacter sp. NIBR1757 TaxID=3016000 RepID=UPI0022F1229D|nr:LytTR family DNA-binding domain-containing protein [Caulobacter sp. NIBR1757]WGM38801.1 hypothetical protein AMEJIAPC_01708 [Caulobacter sp. NIBR1757]
MSDASLKEALANPTAWARRLAYATAAGVFLGAVGAFGTFVAAPAVNRIADWVLMFWVGTLLYPVGTALVMAQGRRWGLSAWFTVPVGVALASLPMTAVSIWATSVFIHRIEGRDFLLTYFQVLLVAMPTVGAYVGWRSRFEPAKPPAPQEPQTIAPPRFLARLPARLGTDLLCLQMEDHYVRAHTTLGSDLILMRMRDAVAELDALPGLPVHRSWWVAARAVAGHRSEDRRLTLILSNGLEVPVARSSAPAVRNAWL